MASELTLRVVHAEAAEYATLNIAQTLPFWTLSYVQHGRVQLDGGATAGSGDLMVHRPHERFVERAQGPGRHLFVLLEVSGVPALDRLPGAFPLADAWGYTASFARVMGGDPLAAASLLMIALTEFESSGIAGRAAPAPGRFGSSIAMMRLRRVSRRELAQTAGLDPGHFDRVFRAEYGESPMTMARRFRLDRLCGDLLDDDTPLEGLAARHGFSEASALIRFFVRETGETPGAYRERAKRSIGRYIGSFARGPEEGKLDG